MPPNLKRAGRFPRTAASQQRNAENTMKILELLKGGLASAASAYAVKVSAEKRDALARSAGDALGDLVFKSGTIPENPYDALAARLEGATRTIPRILAWLWGLLAGAFVCGLWVALVDYRQGRTEEKVEELRREDSLADLRLRGIETAAAATAAKLDAINETLTRIDRRLNP